MGLMSENAALAQANARLVEQLRLLNQKGRKSLDIPSDTASTCAASTCGYTSEAEESEADGKIGSQRRTTAMMRNIPSGYTRADLLELLDKHGFLESYDLLY